MDHKQKLDLFLTICHMKEYAIQWRITPTTRGHTGKTITNSLTITFKCTDNGFRFRRFRFWLILVRFVYNSCIHARSYCLLFMCTKQINDAKTDHYTKARRLTIFINRMIFKIRNDDIASRKNDETNINTMIFI